MTITAPQIFKLHPKKSVFVILIWLLGVAYGGLYLTAPTLWPAPRLDHSDVLEPEFHAGLKAYYDEDYKTAMEIWLPMAEAGHPAAQFRVGRLYDRGEGVTLGLSKAFRWYEISAENGHVDAQYNFGLMYRYGDRVKINSEKFIYWLTQAALQGDDYSQVVLGFEYLDTDDEASDYWFRQAADQGNTIALVVTMHREPKTQATATYSDYACVNFVNFLMDQYFYKC